MEALGLKSKIACCCAAACALAAPTAALALSTANSGVVAAVAGGRVVAHGSVTGRVSALSGWSFAVQTPGRRIGVVNALTAAADRVTGADTPYVYGGGHVSAPNASIGIPGPGYNGKRTGFDCSGAVGAVLVGGGLWPAGSGVPNDAGIIAQLLSEGLIAPGVGRGPVEVTLYDHPGVHIFMNIDGRFFGTSDGAGSGGDARGGAGWLYDGAPDASSAAFKPYHFLPSVLKGSTGSGQNVGFQLSSDGLAGGLVSGERVRVRYRELATGTLIATAITYPGSVTATGAVASIAYDRGSLTIQTPRGATLTLSTAALAQLLDGVTAGDTVQVSYSKVHSTLIAHAIKVTATLQPTGPTGPTGPTAPGSASGGSR